MARWLILGAALGFVVFAAAWRIDGGTWVHVETPSMGEVAPVGSLLWVKPVDFEALAPGDFITFHPPGQGSVTYSHRVLRRTPEGRLLTKGVIPGPDPWRLNSADVVGKVRMNWWGAGWLVVAAPVLIIGFLVVGAAIATARQPWKAPVALVLGSLVLAVALVAFHPLVGAEKLAFAPAAGGGADATYVGTGLLPVRLHAHGDSVVLHDGEVGSVHVDQTDHDGRLRVRLEPAIPMVWWLVLVLPCFLPALVSPATGRRPRPDEARHVVVARRGGGRPASTLSRIEVSARWQRRP
jgi:hypothetical protein